MKSSCYDEESGGGDCNLVLVFDSLLLLLVLNLFFVFIAIISSGSDDDAFAKCAVKQLAILQPHVKRQLPTEAKLFLVGLPFLFFISKLCLSL